MPTIPDASSLARKTRAPTETIARQDISAAGVANAARAKALMGIATDFEKLNEAQATEEFTRASTQMKAVYSETLKEFQNDSDYETLQDRINQTVSERQAKVAESVKNKTALKKFEAWNADKKINFDENVFALSWGKEKDAKRSDLDKSFNMLTDLVTEGDISETAWIAQDMMNAAQEKGYYSQEEGQAVMQKWKDETALTGISRIDDPTKQIEALNSDWAVSHIDPARRQKALADAEKAKKDKDLNDYALSAANSTSRSEALEKALEHPTDKYEAVKKTLEIRNQMETAKNQDLIKTIADEIGTQGQFDRRDPRLMELPAADVAWLEAYYQREKAGIKTTEPDVYRHATTLANNGQWPELQNFIVGEDGTGNPFMSFDDRKRFQDMVSKGKAPDDVDHEKILKAVFGTKVTGTGVAAKNRLIRGTLLIKDWEDAYLAANGKRPSKKEIEQVVVDLKSEYDVNWSIFDEPIVDADHQQAWKLLRDLRVERAKELSPKEYQVLEKRFGKSLDTMSEFEINTHIRKVEQIRKVQAIEPELYQSTIDLIRAKNGDEYIEFEKVYNSLRKIRGL